MDYSVVRLAKEILAMHDLIQEQQAELVYLRAQDEKYHELLGSSLDHNRHMVGSLIGLVMTPGVVEACQAAALKGD